MNRKACRRILESLMEIQNPTREDVELVKIRVADQQDLARVIPNSELIRFLKPPEKEKLLAVLKRKVIRTISGVTVVAVMAKPWACPKDTPCAYCPGGPAQGVPQSYTGHEPAAMRGIQNNYDPYMQVTSRIEQLKAIGHIVDKVELIIMGGTFPSTPIEYQEEFVKRCLNAIIKTETQNLKEAKTLAETSKTRNVGITIETRPDWAYVEQIDHMLSMGVTRVELGVQNIYDDIYRYIKRDHTVKDVIDATRLLKDSGLKVGYHLMPGLPGSSFERDLAAFKKIFHNSNFKPDMIKIYPCLVIKGTKTFEWWKNGKYLPFSTEDAVNLISKIKRFVPPWVRIMRVQRDIPAYLVEAGVKKSNLRQLALERLKQGGMRCRCIRCREVGHRWVNDKIEPDLKNLKILSIREKASEGTDIFISIEDPSSDTLIGYSRLRIPSQKSFRPEITSKNSSIVRELHVYGSLVPVGKHSHKAWQHKGYGKILLNEAERISREEYDRQKVAVISALGTKEYYIRLGYTYDGPYMSKMLGK
ncbi:MAG: tRNA uridine(34) 5-carboxymethylaminomethyl modification radical SAM/GNAT enzyme Elp3 [Candidatus Bathyarchaeota archaeon]|nr:MAG: tRNA uridine(34) 5-carboxymethylaminomethyl modification radical SAM/GNAT enzyme Elp3 [Candidatus Bathyarchaeota archaeon]